MMSDRLFFSHIREAIEAFRRIRNPHLIEEEMATPIITQAELDELRVRANNVLEHAVDWYLASELCNLLQALSTGRTDLDADYIEHTPPATFLSLLDIITKDRKALTMFYEHYPSGINPDLDKAYQMARAALALVKE